MRLDSLLRWDTIGTPLFKIYLFYLITSLQKLFRADFIVKILTDMHIIVHRTIDNYRSYNYEQRISIISMMDKGISRFLRTFVFIHI